MSKRLLTLVTIVLLLSVFSIAQAQETVSSYSFGQTQTGSFQFHNGGHLAIPGAYPANANGFIMSDGRICNPRWGC